MRRDEHGAGRTFGLRWCSALMLMLGTLVIAWPAAVMVLDKEPVIEPAAGIDGLADRAWICVTPERFCATAPKPTGDPCSCPDPLTGWQAGQTRINTSVPEMSLPFRGAGAGDDPAEAPLAGP